MGHGTRVSGVNKAVTVGFTLVDGVQRKVKQGMTLVDGVQRAIPFAPAVFTMTITGTGHQNICYVKIGTTKHYTAKTLEVEAGTVATFHAQRKNSSSGAAYADTVMLNGVKVSGGTGTSSDYEYTINGNISVELGYSSGDGSYRGNIDITEE